MKNFLTVLTMGLLIFVVSGIASASFISRDLVSGTGDGYITYDDQTGMEWLDVTLSRYNTIPETLSGDYVTSMGFRLATGSELISLFNGAGLSIKEFTYVREHNPDTQNALSLISLLGPIYDDGFNYSINALYADVFPDPYVSIPLRKYATLQAYEGMFKGYYIGDYMISFTNDPSYGIRDGDVMAAGEGNYGQFLVRTSQEPIPTPEPGTMMMLGFGIAGLVVYGKRRNRNKA